MTAVSSHLVSGLWQPPALSEAQPFSAHTELDRRVPAANDTVLPHDIGDFDESSEQEVPDAASSAHGNAKLKLRRIIGPRLQRARELSGLGQSEAARLIGYATPAQLSLWEKGWRLAPISELIKAARIYGVSIDFLTGESDEVDRDPSMGMRHSILKGVRHQLERVAEITVDEVARHAKLVGPHAGQVRDVIAAGESMLAGYAALVRLNEAVFDDLRGSATLVRFAQEFEQALQAARIAIRLHDSLDSDLRRRLAELDDSDHVPPGGE